MNALFIILMFIHNKDTVSKCAINDPVALGVT